MTARRISDADELRRHLPQLLAAKIMAVRLGTSGPDPHVDRVCSLWMAVKDHPTLFIDGAAFSVDDKLLQQIFATAAVKVFRDAKHDLQFLTALGIFPRPLFDVSLAGQLLGLPDAETGHDDDVRNLLRLRENMMGD